MVTQAAPCFGQPVPDTLARRNEPDGGLGLMTSETQAAARPANALATARRIARPLRRAARVAKRRAEELRDPTLAWLSAADRKQPTDDADWDRLEAKRRELVRRLAPGGSFADVGGMYRIAGDIAFTAEQAGATRVVLFDGMDPSDEFAEAYERHGSKLAFVQGDLHDPDLIDELGTFDVVWCTGVIYHTPNPIQQLQHLRRMTNKTLVIGTNVIPEMGEVEQVALLYPGFKDDTQASFTKFFGVGKFPGMTSSFDESVGMAYANMWWGLSPSALRSALTYAGFKITEEYLHTPFWMDIVATPDGVPPSIYPPLEQSAGRVLARHEGVPLDELPLWARGQVASLRAAEQIA
jgi:hypothetical protein